MAERPSPFAVRLSEEAIELIRFVISSPNSKYESMADYVREAVEEKFARESTRSKYETVKQSLEEWERKNRGK